MRRLSSARVVVCGALAGAAVVALLVVVRRTRRGQGGKKTPVREDDNAAAADDEESLESARARLNSSPTAIQMDVQHTAPLDYAGGTAALPGTPQRASFDLLDKHVAVEICVVACARDVARLRAASRVTRRCVDVACESLRRPLGLLTDDGRAEGARVSTALIPRLLWDRANQVELVGEAGARRAAAADARGAADDALDATIRATARAHGTRLCPGLGLMVTRLAKARLGARGDLGSFFGFAAPVDGQSEHPIGRLLLETFRTTHDGPRGALQRGVIVALYNEGIAASWTFYCGRRAWVLVSTDVEDRWSADRRFGLARWKAPKSLVVGGDAVASAAPPCTAAARAGARRALERTYAFWRTAQRLYLSESECVPDELMIPHRRVLPRCGACEACLIETPLRCSRCKQAWYCGIACQRENWAGHKAECALALTRTPATT